MQKHLDKIKEHLENIPSSYEKTEECAFLIRSALALSVHVFYYKNYGLTVNIPSSLNEDIKDSRFKGAFYKNMMILSDIQSIRIACNTIIHPTVNSIANFSAQDMKELHERLLKCIRAIEEKIKLNIIPVVSTFNKNNLAQIMTTDNDDNKAKEVFAKAGLDDGAFLHVSGIREFVERYFNQSKDSTKGIMTTRWGVPWYDKEIVWVVEMVNSEPATQGVDWINVYKNDEIIEIMPKGKTTWNKIPVRQYAKEHPYRIAVEKISNGLIVRGVYKFDENKSINDLKHYYTKI